MKIFIDTANVEHIREAWDMGIIDGVTTNPTLVSKTGKGFREVVEEIMSIVDGPISLEVISLESEGMVKEARKLAEYGPNAVIKVPMTAEGLKATKILSKEGIKTNVTLVFSPNQALLAAKAGATYMSPFVGRLDDISQWGMDIIETIVDIYNNYDFETQVLAASLRHPMHVIEAALAGAHVATIPYDVLMKMVKHPKTDEGIDNFLKDWEKVPSKDIF